MRYNILKAALVAGAMLVPGVASAATAAAIVTTDLNIRTGPGVQYQRFETIPVGDRVSVVGCLSGYNWCDVEWAGTRGWVSGSYLAYREGGNYYDRPISSIGISIGVPVVGFDPYVYHDRYYRGRSWYRDRYLDHRRREARRDWREDRREDRRDWREDRRDDRRDWRDDRRDNRRDWREDRREDRRDARDDRRDRRDARDDDRRRPSPSPEERRRIDEAKRDIRQAWPGFRD